jgi:hypothetical protein
MNHSAEPRKNKYMRIIQIIVLAAISIFGLGCTDLFSKLDNPADPDSGAYQGFETVINVDDVRPNYSGRC